jgi:DNA replication protein DnaC
MTFEELDPRGRAPFADPATFRKASEAAKTFAAGPRGWLAITGPSGVGKTHLAAAIVNFSITQGQPARFVFVPEFLDRLRAAIGDRAGATGQGQEDYEAMLATVAAAPLLVLDDLGPESTTQWAGEKLRQVLSYRYDNRLPTVFTTRLAPESMDEWLRVRLSDPALSHVAQVRAGAMNVDLTEVGIEPRMRQTMTFEAFDPRGGTGATSEQRDRLRDALQTAQAFAADPDRWLYMSGPTGVGKTHLAVAIAASRIARRQPVLFRFTPDLLDHLRRSFSPDSHTSYDRAFEQLKNAELLILDDFGAQAWTPWAEEKMYQLIVHRYNAALPTVITSRVLLDEMDHSESAGDMRFGRRYSDAIASRFRDGTLVSERLLSAPDYRNRGSERPALRPGAKQRGSVRARSA